MRCTLDSIDEKLGSSESGGGSEVFRVLRAINIIESTTYEVWIGTYEEPYQDLLLRNDLEVTSGLW